MNPGHVVIYPNSRGSCTAEELSKQLCRRRGQLWAVAFLGHCGDVVLEESKGSGKGKGGGKVQLRRGTLGFTKPPHGQNAP